MNTGKIQRVFILDRNEAQAQHLQTMVANYCSSAVVHCCPSGPQALRQLNIFKSIPIDLVLMDVDLFHCGGNDFINSVITNSAKCTFAPVVFFTSSSNTALDKWRNLPLPYVNDFLHKPVLPEFLHYLLDFHFDREGINGFKGAVIGR